MHLSLQLGMQFTELTDTWLNAPQALPELWASPLNFCFKWHISVRTALKSQEEQSLTRSLTNCADLPWVQILYSLDVLQSNKNIYKAKHLFKKCVKKK